jgi:hypothetical protein
MVNDPHEVEMPGRRNNGADEIFSSIYYVLIQDRSMFLQVLL